MGKLVLLSSIMAPLFIWAMLVEQSEQYPSGVQNKRFNIEAAPTKNVWFISIDILQAFNTIC